MVQVFRTEIMLVVEKLVYLLWPCMMENIVVSVLLLPDEFITLENLLDNQDVS